jgi:hypothetical protein
MTQEQFIRRSAAELSTRFGFEAENSLASVCLCRDELCTPFAVDVASEWGEAFNLRSLGGMVWVGRTGFGALRSHAPEVDNRERHVFFVLPHIGIGDDGSIGISRRPGQSRDTTACGALVGILGELQSGHVNILFDHRDVEQSLLRQRLVMEWDFRADPDLITLTKAALRAGRGDLESLIKESAEDAPKDYALLSGILIHATDGSSYVWPQACYVHSNGQKQDLTLTTGV